MGKTRRWLGHGFGCVSVSDVGGLLKAGVKSSLPLRRTSCVQKSKQQRRFVDKRSFVPFVEVVFMFLLFLLKFKKQKRKMRVM